MGVQRTMNTCQPRGTEKRTFRDICEYHTQDSPVPRTDSGRIHLKTVRFGDTGIVVNRSDYLRTATRGLTLSFPFERMGNQQ